MNDLRLLGNPFASKLRCFSVLMKPSCITKAARSMIVRCVILELQQRISIDLE